MTWLSVINSQSGIDVKEKRRIFEMCENQASYLVNKLKEILSTQQIKERMSDDRPTIPVGKKDRYYVCSFCGVNVSVQFKNCPNCRTPNPDVQTL